MRMTRFWGPPAPWPSRSSTPGSPGGMLMDTQPKDFNTLVRLSGFSHGTDVWLGNARDLIRQRHRQRSGQAVGCRDDIMLYLISMRP